MHIVLLRQRDVFGLCIVSERTSEGETVQIRPQERLSTILFDGEKPQTEFDLSREIQEETRDCSLCLLA